MMFLVISNTIFSDSKMYPTQSQKEKASPFCVVHILTGARSNSQWPVLSRVNESFPHCIHTRCHQLRAALWQARGGANSPTRVRVHSHSSTDITRLQSNHPDHGYLPRGLWWYMGHRHQQGPWLYQGHHSTHGPCQLRGLTCCLYQDAPPPTLQAAKSSVSSTDCIHLP